MGWRSGSSEPPTEGAQPQTAEKRLGVAGLRKTGSARQRSLAGSPRIRPFNVTIVVRHLIRRRIVSEHKTKRGATIRTVERRWSFCARDKILAGCPPARPFSRETTEPTTAAVTTGTAEDLASDKGKLRLSIVDHQADGWTTRSATALPALATCTASTAITAVASLPGATAEERATTGVAASPVCSRKPWASDPAVAAVAAATTCEIRGLYQHPPLEGQVQAD